MKAVVELLLLFYLCTIYTNGYDKPTACYFKPDYGNCTGKNETRVYYDEKQHICLYFTYSGCGGNGNNFRNLRLCWRRCLHYNLNRDLCQRTPGHTVCLFSGDYETMWYFSSRHDRCVQFSHGRCGSLYMNVFSTCGACRERCQHRMYYRQKCPED
uniref:Tissue factor pathway inhibitor n=1 Tax=Rhipicephalus zambeziensis TaxID=60191 RepID=A0A224YFP8_9ACAR